MRVSGLCFSRIADLAPESVESERLCPELRILREPLTREQIIRELEGEQTYAVIFGIQQHIGNELYPLIVDAFVSDSERYGRPYFRVIGAYKDWFTEDGRAKRAIFFNHEREEFKESDLLEPLYIDIAHFLHFPKCGEHNLHQELSDTFRRWGIPQVNPHSVSAIADDKMATYRLLEKEGIPVPRTFLLPEGLREGRIRYLTRAFCEMIGEMIVVKPNNGTEGDGVEVFERDDCDEIIGHIFNLREKGYNGILLQEKRGNVRYCHPEDGRSRSLDLRINVAWDGETFRAESGYAQVGGEPGSFASSVGRGGMIIGVREAMERLVVEGDKREEMIVLDSDDRQEMERAAVRTAETINRGCEEGEHLLFMGIDLKIEMNKMGYITPIVLDINPRPAGIGHSRFLQSDWSGEVGVTLRLWEGVESLLDPL